ncbi:MAG: hypothetical protein C0619_07990 [Desulfuromonas sp.]|nr:MAG: hypothetical protein C0619_07990 [Desulfuromonas sp.]
MSSIRLFFLLLLSLFLHLATLQLKFESDHSPSAMYGRTEIGLVRLHDAKHQLNSEAGGVPVAETSVEPSAQAKQKSRASSDRLSRTPPSAAEQKADALPSPEARIPLEKTVDAAKLRPRINRPANRQLMNAGASPADRSGKQRPAETELQTSVSTVTHRDINKKPEPDSLPDKKNTSHDHEGHVSVSDKAFGSTRLHLSPAEVVKKAALPAAIPRYADNPDPHYPDVALRKGWEGLVMLRVDVNKNGLVRNVTVAASSGFKVLDQAAVRAVSRWTFVPAMLSGLPVDGRAMIPISFVLP